MVLYYNLGEFGRRTRQTKEILLQSDQWQQTEIILIGQGFLLHARLASLSSGHDSIICSSKGVMLQTSAFPKFATTVSQLP